MITTENIYGPSGQAPQPDERTVTKEDLRKLEEDIVLRLEELYHYLGVHRVTLPKPSRLVLK